MKKLLKKIKKLKLEKRNLIIIIIIVCITILSTSIFTYAKYQRQANSVAPLEYALYILNTNPISDTIKISDIKPSNDEYVYPFSISNFKNKDRLETDLEYTLTIKTTTNLPLDFRLVVNDDYKTNTNNAFIKDELIQDADGTYFRVMASDKKTFSFKENETNYYYLVVKFPLNYIDSKYQDITEFINIEINSKQVIEE